MECEGCTLCCYIAPAPWLNKDHSTLCEHCEPGVGCKIWDNIPKQCNVFFCWYRLSKNLPKDLKPDVCGVVIEKYDDLFLLTTEPGNFEAWYNVKEFIKQVNQKGYSCVITSYTDPRRLVFAAHGQKTNDVMQRMCDLAKKEYEDN